MKNKIHNAVLLVGRYVTGVARIASDTLSGVLTFFGDHAPLLGSILFVPVRVAGGIFLFFVVVALLNDIGHKWPIVALLLFLWHSARAYARECPDGKKAKR